MKVSVYSKQNFHGMKKGMRVSGIIPLFAILRPWQWVKNLAVGIPMLFSGTLFYPTVFWETVLAFFSLCFLSSAHYIFNDIVDVKEDRLHPFKKVRPLAQATVSKQTAWILWMTVTVIGFALSSILGIYFFLIAVTYALVHYGMVLVFRKIPILDILVLATCYVLRIAAGGVATGVHVSVWLFLSALCLSMLLAIGKRRFELRLATEHNLKVPLLYSARLLDAYLSMFAAASFLSYSYFTFLTTFASDTTDLTSPFVGRKWLMMTIPFALYGILKYLQQLYVGTATSYVKLLATSPSLLITAFLWFLSCVGVIYGIGK